MCFWIFLEETGYIIYILKLNEHNIMAILCISQSFEVFFQNKVAKTLVTSFK